MVEKIMRLLQGSWTAETDWGDTYGGVLEFAQ